MKKVLWRAFFDYEKEEKWLNEMAAKGLAFNDYVFFRYTFTDCEPGEYIYRIELLDNLPGHPESKKYLGFMAENGVEHISSWARWVYFRKKAAAGSFDIFSDIDSRLMHYRRIAMLWVPLMFMELAIGISNIVIGLGSLHEEAHEISLPNLIAGALLICIFIAIFIAWNSLRLKVKALKQEKALRE